MIITLQPTLNRAGKQIPCHVLHFDPLLRVMYIYLSTYLYKTYLPCTQNVPQYIATLLPVKN